MEAEPRRTTCGRVDQILREYYCRVALLLCRYARDMLENNDFEGASKLCAFISTLCERCGFEGCLLESKLCGSVSKLCLDPERRREAIDLCDEARKVCPRSLSIYGG